MPSGDIVVKVSTAQRLIPIEGAKVFVARRNVEGNDSVIATRNTSRSGITVPVTISAPERELSQKPGNGEPFTSVDIRIEHPLYYPNYIVGAQIFADTQSVQNVVLIPRAIPTENLTEDVFILPQNL